MNPQRTGYGMGIAAVLVVGAMLVFFFSGEIDRQQHPNRQVIGAINEQGVREVVLQRNRQGHYVADGMINGQAATFLLDTGATTVAIPGRIADQLLLEKGQKTLVNTANGLSDAYRTRLDSVSLGAITLQDVAANIAPGYQSDEILLGMAFLKQVEFTQRGETLTLRQYPD